MGWTSSPFWTSILSSALPSSVTLNSAVTFFTNSLHTGGVVSVGIIGATVGAVVDAACGVGVALG